MDERIRALGGWRAETLAEVRRLICEVEPEIVEACKWSKPGNPLGVPVWSRAGIVCTGEAYRETVKLTFPRGAELPDPHGLFNAGLAGKARRAVDLREGERLDAEAFRNLIRAAVAANLRAGSPQPGAAAGGERDRRAARGPAGAKGGTMFEPASGEEIGAVLALMREYYAADGYDFDAGRASAALAALVADPALGRLWVAREAGVVVAYLAVTYGFSLEYGGRDAFLDELVVAPAHRGRGLGRRALAVAEAACRQAGVRALHLDLEPGKPGAARLYRAAGFLPLPRRRLTKRLA